MQQNIKDKASALVLLELLALENVSYGIYFIFNYLLCVIGIGILIPTKLKLGFPGTEKPSYLKLKSGTRNRVGYSKLVRY